MTDFPVEEKFDPEFDYPEHELADEKNGTRLKTEKSFASIAAEMAMKVGRKVLTGNLNIMAILPPSKVLASSNHLELCQDAIVLFKNYIEMATQLKDPVERQKYLSTGFLANNYIPDTRSCGQIPIPVFKNEYLEGFTSDGSYIFSRCLTKDPNVVCLRLVGPNTSYTYDLTQEVKVEADNLMLTAWKCQRFTTVCSLLLHDGTEYSIEYPSFLVQEAISNDKNLVYINITKDDCYIYDKTNGYKALFEFVKPESKGLFSMFGDDPKPTVHQKNVVKARIVKVDNNAKPTGPDLSTGGGNMLSYIQFDGYVLWKINDLVEEWCYDKPDYNTLETSSIKRKYNKAIKDGDYDKADEELEKVDAEPDITEPFIRKFPPEQELQQSNEMDIKDDSVLSDLVNELNTPLHKKSEISTSMVETKKKSVDKLMKTPSRSPKRKQSNNVILNMETPSPNRRNKKVQPEIKFHQQEVKFVYVNGKKKLKANIVVENFGPNNIVLKAKSNVQSRYAVKPVLQTIGPKSSVKIDFIALTQNVSNAEDLNDKFLFTYKDIGDKIIADSNLQDFFKSEKVKCLHAKMPIRFYNENGEVLYRLIPTKNSNIETNLINSPRRTTAKVNYVSDVIMEDPKEFRKESMVKGGIEVVESGSTERNEESKIELQKQQQELDKVNKKAKYLQSQVDKNGPVKKKSSYEMWHLFAALVFGMYIGNLFLTSPLI